VGSPCSCSLLFRELNMSVAPGVQAPVNGLPRRPTEVNEAIEYEKIISIYKQVIAGNHPRLRLSGAVIPPLPASLEQHSAQPPVPTAVSAVSEPAPPTQLPGLQLSSSAKELPAKTANQTGSSLSARPMPAKPPPSELDPIFLTKSDDLVRAEIQLQRQRAERVLREQLEQKRVDARHKPSFAEAKPEFDVADVLTKSLALVKPVIFDDPRAANENGSASDSFDENSFYSSKAPDSTPRDGDDSQKSSISKHQVQPVDHDELDADGLVDRPSDEMQQVDLTDGPYKVIPRPAFYTAPNLHHRHEAKRARNDGPPLAPIPLDDEEEEEEPEYSPPEPAQPAYFNDIRHAIPGGGYPERGRRLHGRRGNQHPDTRRHESPTDADVRIVRNHITSPIAPQPSRVSPLAVAKGPPISQNRRHRQDYGQQRRVGGAESERTSPDMVVPIAQPRKKRKVQDGRKGGRRRTLASPDPIIKDEPVSPPPFHNVPPLGATRHRPAAERPIYIDAEPSRDVRYVPDRRPEPSTRQVIYDVEEQTPHSAPRVLSRAGLRDVPKADQDLRRVVSLQNLPAREYAEPAYPTPTRISQAPSYAVAEGAGRPPGVGRFEGAPQVYDMPRVIEERPLTSQAYGDVEPEYRHAIQPMAPPPQRRIIVDEYGQRFYESIQPRASVAPPPTRRLDVDRHNEIATLRNGATRATSVLEEPHRETRYIQDMPPPQMVYRRVAEGPRSASSEVRYVTEAPRPAPSDVRYVTREAVETRPAQRSGSVQMYDYSARHPAYVDDNMLPRESIMRVSSVRPAGRPYEQPQEVFERVQSVRPEGRELSVFPEERSQVRREHVQGEGPRYEVRRFADGDRYYRIDDGGRMMVDGATDARPAFAPRY
jgi:hypothetical protein